jgi:hypothetical protein
MIFTEEEEDDEEEEKEDEEDGDEDEEGKVTMEIATNVFALLCDRALTSNC